MKTHAKFRKWYLININEEHWKFTKARISRGIGILYKCKISHDDVDKWKHFPRYWPFVRGSTGHRWIPLTKANDAELWLISAWTNGWADNQDAGDLRRHSAHYDVTVMEKSVLNCHMCLYTDILPIASLCGLYISVHWKPEKISAFHAMSKFVGMSSHT